MKNAFKILFNLLALVAFVFLVACEGPAGPSGPAGPAGANGTDGIDGVDGTDGMDGNATCAVCHNEGTAFALKMVEFNESAHALGTYYTRGGQCAACHSTEGFLDRANHTAIGDIDGMMLEHQTPISCRTCHMVHYNYDDTDWELTFTDQVTETIFGYTSPAYESEALADKGDANMCLQCHQSRDRGNVPAADATGLMTTGSTHWGPHYGVQGNVTNSTGGVEVAGSMDYPTNVVGHDCITCHMVEGTHTLEVNFAGCTDCHSTIEDDIDAIQDKIAGLKDDLIVLLVDQGGLTDNMDGTYTPVGGEMPVDVAKALWNYMVVYQDHSYGVHNEDYIEALLVNSIELLTPPV